MLKAIINKSFLVTIFIVLTLACFVLMVLLWNRFTHIDEVTAEHNNHQRSEILIKDIKFNIVQIQQFLTDVSLTQKQAGFQEAETHLQVATKGLDALGELQPGLRVWCGQLKNQVTLSYETGVRMAMNYLYKGKDIGGLTMNRFDVSSAKLTDDLNRLAQHLDEDMQKSDIENQRSIRTNELVLLISVPVVLGFFGGIIIKISLLLKRQMRCLELRTIQLNSILDTAPSAIITLDSQGRVLTFNAVAEQIFGYQSHEIIGTNVKCLMPEQTASQHDFFLQRFIESQRSNVLVKRREVEGQRKNGEVFPAHLAINSMVIVGKQFFCGVIDDISETKALQAQLNQAQKLEAIGQLSSGVAHEINTPIQYIGDNLSALQGNFADFISFQQAACELIDQALQPQLERLVEQFDVAFLVEDSPKAITQALDGVAKVTEIVKAMKTFSHVEASLQLQTLNVHEALQSALIICRNSYKYIAEIETNFSPEVGSIPCYPNELNQVFLNLIINASHAIEEKQAGIGLIRIITRKFADNVEILIADNGIGISEQNKEKVFNLFFTTKPVGKGTGQGLSLAHHIIVEKHCGKLFFESSLGIGTTFHIQLPILLEG